MKPTPEQVERGAKAMFEATHGEPWKCASTSGRIGWRNSARIALTAALREPRKSKPKKRSSR